MKAKKSGKSGKKKKHQRLRKRNSSGSDSLIRAALEERSRDTRSDRGRQRETPRKQKRGDRRERWHLRRIRK